MMFEWEKRKGVLLILPLTISRVGGNKNVFCLLFYLQSASNALLSNAFYSLSSLPSLPPSLHSSFSSLHCDTAYGNHFLFYSLSFHHFRSRGSLHWCTAKDETKRYVTTRSGMTTPRPRMPYVGTVVTERSIPLVRSWRHHVLFHRGGGGREMLLIHSSSQGKRFLFKLTRTFFSTFTSNYNFNYRFVETIL